VAYVINIRSKIPLGGTGGLVAMYGDYTCTNGDTLTLTVPGANPIGFYWWNNANNLVVTNTLSSKTTAGSQTTYTLTSTATIAATAPFLWLVEAGD
jgi:hypothetical protein